MQGAGGGCFLYKTGVEIISEKFWGRVSIETKGGVKKETSNVCFTSPLQKFIVGLSIVS